MKAVGADAAEGGIMKKHIHRRSGWLAATVAFGAMAAIASAQHAPPGAPPPPPSHPSPYSQPSGAQAPHEAEQPPPPYRQAVHSPASTCPTVEHPLPICRESADERRERLSAIRGVRGWIVRTKTVEVRGTGQHNLVAMLATDRGGERLIVDLGPAQDLRAMPVQPGQRLAAEGVVKRLGDRQVLVATRLLAGSHRIAVDRSHQARLAQQALARQQEQERAEVTESP
jgi:hypothetical protein